MDALQDLIRFAMQPMSILILAFYIVAGIIIGLAIKRTMEKIQDARDGFYY